MKFLKFLDLKKSYFVNGWANFDQISHTQIGEALSKGAYIEDFDSCSQLTLNAIQTYDELMTFGKISDKGLMNLCGITGFPFDSKCVEYCRVISKNAEISEIHHHSIHIEW